jgi:hypothetical protein
MSNFCFPLILSFTSEKSARRSKKVKGFQITIVGYMRQWNQEFEFSIICNIKVVSYAGRYKYCPFCEKLHKRIHVIPFSLFKNKKNAVTINGIFCLPSFPLSL